MTSKIFYDYMTVWTTFVLVINFSAFCKTYSPLFPSHGTASTNMFLIMILQNTANIITSYQFI